jgi:hypothetical protein
MFKSITNTLFTYGILMIQAQAAAPSKAIFKDLYQGTCTIQTPIDGTYYDKVIFKINKTGNITGTAHNQKSGALSSVKGTIGKVTVQFGNGYTGKAIGSFSDGTKWTASVVATKGFPDKGINGTAKNGAATGIINLTTR